MLVKDTPCGRTREQFAEHLAVKRALLIIRGDSGKQISMSGRLAPVLERHNSRADLAAARR